MTPAQAIALASARMRLQRPAGSVAAQVMADPITQGALGFARDMPLHKQLAAGAGSMLTDLGQGAAQIAGMGPSEKEVEERRDLDVPLMATPGGFTGKLAGGVAATAPAVLAGSTLPAVAATGAAYGALQPVGEDESRAFNTTAGALTAGASKFGMDKAAPWLAKTVAGKRAAAAPVNARAQELARVLKEGRESGLTVPPSQANPSAVNRVLESISGKASTQQAAALRNQDVVYAASQRHAGLPANVALTKPALAEAREVAAAPYRQVANSSPEAAVMLKNWRDMNQRASMHWDEFARTKSVAAYDAYEAAKRGANLALEDIERLAGPALKGELQAARVQIAKIHTVAKALRGSSIDPRSYMKAAERGEPISGEIGKIARFSQDFPKAMTAPQQGGSVGVNQLLPWLGGGGGGVVGAALGGPAGAGVGSVAGMAATQAVPPAVRSLLLSGPYQAAMTKPPMTNPTAASRLAAALLNDPRAKAMLPAMSAMASSQ